ncbi:M56 family metallopeptidase [Gramella sp. AN32]|uniref:M56 family metallopeptidase n=1 Tax=Christiangramia antarctica TaxID=2058158 RepID=A0ABW5X6U8_9FLAO|nr:M56 family metallopeptidase [Gramella sp. AN32]MCM4156090.1 hypothetical protein [Gramella sp. AN32]
MLEYILKSGLCLLVLFSFYKLFMEGETFHSIKRIYLLLALAISLMLPLITISYNIEIPTEEIGETIVLKGVKSATEVSERASWKELLPGILLGIYFIGFSIFAFRFYKNLKDLISEANKNDQLKDLPYIYVLLGRKLDPHSFFQYIFLNKEEFRNDKISSAVMEHEKAHVDQKHSLDLFFLELIHIVFWFNPVFIFIKKSVKLNHEFLADHRVLQKAYCPLQYSNILFQYSSGHHHNALSSPINHSLIKKRIIMITKSFSLRRLFLKSFLFLPVLGVCVYLFNEEIVAKPVPTNAETITSVSGNIQEQVRTIKIKVEGEKIQLNTKLVSLENFSEALNKITRNWSQEDMKSPWFEIDFENSTTEFIQKLNKEYRKSKLSKISDTEFLAPSPVVPSGTPPPPPPPPVQGRNGSVPLPPAAAPHLDQDTQRENLFSIKIIGTSLQVNGKEIKPKDFSETLDKLSEDKTDEELKNYNFRMHISDPAPGFMEKLNHEFKKSRMSKITGHEILPPPPPAPPMEGTMPPLPSPAPNTYMEDSTRIHHDKMKLVHESIQNELQRMEKIQLNYLKDSDLSKEELEKKRREIALESERIQLRMEESQKREEERELIMAKRLEAHEKMIQDRKLLILERLEKYKKSKKDSIK